MDFYLLNGGSIYQLEPLTDAAAAWIEDNVNHEGFQPYWPTVIIDARYTDGIVSGLIEDGFIVGEG
ncbi:hypothetical protein HYZ97_00995 [Candidatus Pacearchaeota archaeon]|nr:hypothetical protein [Candidatus Pacearchaeota archaeon]